MLAIHSQFYIFQDHAILLHYGKKKPTGAYEDMLIYYIYIAVNLLHVLVTFRGHLCTLVWVSVTYASEKHVPEDGHTRWRTHVRCSQRLKRNKFTCFQCALVHFMLVTKTRKRLVGLHVKFTVVRSKPHLEYPPAWQIVHRFSRATTADGQKWRS